MVNKSFRDNLLKGIVGNKDLSYIKQRTKCPITLYQLNSLNLAKNGDMKYEIKTLHFPSIKIEDRNRHVRLLVVDDSEHVVLIRDYYKFINAISKTLNVACTEWPIGKDSNSIVSILSPDGNSL